MTTLNRNELQQCLDSLKKLIADLNESRFAAWDAKEITIDIFNTLHNYELALGSHANLLAVKIIDLSLTDLLDSDSPANRITAGTDKANRAVKNLKEIEKAFQSLANVLDLFGAIVKAVQMPSLVTVAGILNTIDSL